MPLLFYLSLSGGSCPCAPHRIGDLLPACRHERQVMLLGNLHTGVPQQDRDLIERYSPHQQIDGKRIAKAMRVAMLNSSRLEQFLIPPAPIVRRRGDSRFPGPEVVATPIWGD